MAAIVASEFRAKASRLHSRHSHDFIFYSLLFYYVLCFTNLFHRRLLAATVPLSHTWNVLNCFQIFSVHWFVFTVCKKSNNMPPQRLNSKQLFVKYLLYYELSMFYSQYLWCGVYTIHACSMNLLPVRLHWRIVFVRVRVNTSWYWKVRKQRI